MMKGRARLQLEELRRISKHRQIGIEVAPRGSQFDCGSTVEPGDDSTRAGVER